MRTYTLTVTHRQEPLSMNPSDDNPEIEVTFTLMQETHADARARAVQIMTTFPEMADALLETADGEELPF